MKTIATERLLLRPGKRDDIPEMLAALNDWSISQWLIRPPYPYRPEDAAQFVNSTLAEQTKDCPGCFVIANLAGDELLGVIMLECEAETVAEAGYWLKPAAWGRGYATEALRALIADGFRRQPALGTVFALTDPDNSKSQSVLLRAGLRLVARGLRAQPNRRNTMEDMQFEISRP